MTNGAFSGTNATARQTFLYTLATVAVFCAGVNILAILTVLHDAPDLGLIWPTIWEASSWITLVLFFWIPWLGFRLAPPLARPRWRLFFHLPAFFAFSLCHVGGFVLLRRLAYWLLESRYEFGPFWTNFLYEFRKDAVGYVLFIAGFVSVSRLLCHSRQADAPARPATFDIRDGTRLNRVPVKTILAVSAAGNYTEFILTDGSRLTMRSSLSALEAELRAHGFLRTHRSWLVNTNKMTALEPQGSGDYAVHLGSLSVPLSRRYPDALAHLRNNNGEI